MMSRLAVPVLLVCVTGCVPDPKVDPCRELTARSPACDEDAASPNDVDAGDEPDAAEQDPADAQVDVDADWQPPMEAGPGPSVDASKMPDSARPDTTATVPPRDDSGVPRALALQGDLGVHDPSIIEAAGSFVIISTGRGLSVKRSTDLLTWTGEGSVFAKNPAWIAKEVPGATDLWAPDIVSFGGKYHLYYSASTFGSRDSCIGHATATDLSVMNFVDQGPVVCTEPADDYNAIDPAVVLDEAGMPWLSFGSFWSGIKLIPLNAAGQRSGTDMFSLASRADVEAIEAPVIVRRDGYYYLFVSFDVCCRGASSTYNIRVGRSENVAGPYVDAEGKPMLVEGGGSTVVVGNQRWRGPGHNAVLTFGASQYLVYHAYDANNAGRSTLRIADLLWGSDGWPLPVGP